jgi:hypothetical protein
MGSEFRIDLRLGQALYSNVTLFVKLESLYGCHGSFKDSVTFMNAYWGHITCRSVSLHA